MSTIVPAQVQTPTCLHDQAPLPDVAAKDATLPPLQGAGTCPPMTDCTIPATPKGAAVIPTFAEPLSSTIRPIEAKLARNELPLSPCKGSIANAICLELCCGSAGLSQQLHLIGADALGVDWNRNPSKPKAALLRADLADPEGQELVRSIAERHNTAYVHAAVPCGTASKSREKHIPEKLRRMGAPTPRQLRSETMPEGLPGLSPNEQMRVDLANAIYIFVAALLFWCQLNGKL